MQTDKLQNSNLKNQFYNFRFALIFAGICLIAVSAGFFFNQVSAQTASPVQTAAPTTFRVGERLTYNISLGKFANAGYAETYVVSRGKIANKEAVELRSKIKTNSFVSAAFYFSMKRGRFSPLPKAEFRFTCAKSKTNRFYRKKPFTII
jgi:hypothetical protein